LVIGIVLSKRLQGQAVYAKINKTKNKIKQVEKLRKGKIIILG